MKLQSLTIIFIIIILPITFILSTYIGYELKTLEKQNRYNSGIISATHDAIFSFEINTKNDEYSNNPEYKRDIIKAAVKTFENSFSTTCNIELYGNDKIEEYIPAILFGMYDGFYIYAPYQTKENGYKHDLRNYVYYSETIEGTDINIIYSLDNYVVVSGTFYNETKHENEYMTKAGYLIAGTISGNPYKVDYKGISISNLNEDSYAYKYFLEGNNFTNWFLNDAKLGEKETYLNISNTNDPEDENSEFVKHKRKIMKDKIQSILNSSITSYAKKIGNNYKMPILTEDEWNKIYSDISLVSFVQGMNLGFKKYNNYCVLNSTNNNEYVNPNLIYYTYKDENNNFEYHDIRCSKLTEAQNASEIVGYKIGDFEKMTEETTDNETEETTKRYYYNHYETACYECINGALRDDINIYKYINDIENLVIKKAYYAALARERYKTTKLSNRLLK